jgi:GT2 family glycosyltransferase
LKSKISIIVINYKNIKDTFQCVKSLNENMGEYKAFCDVLIVDNASVDDSCAKLQEIYPDIRVLYLKRNEGFAGANNSGIITALGNNSGYFFLLNNDALVRKDTIKKMLEVFDEDSKIGIVGATILDFNNPKMIDNMGAMIDYRTGSSRFVANGEIYGDGRKDVDVDYTCGAAMMIKREVVEKVGLLPEFYFLYGEEKDYCVQAKKKGFRVVNSGKATVIHKTSSTVSKYLGVKNYYFHRNRFLFLRLHAKPHQYLFAVLHSGFILLPVYVFRYTVRNRSNPKDGLKELHSFITGLFDGIRCKTGYTKKIN